MPYNFPTVTTQDITFGPAIVRIGPAGTTPLSDIGAVGDDGVTITITRSRGEIRQGNPKHLVMGYADAEDVEVAVQGLEYNWDTLLRALGSGVTAATGTSETFHFGGDPLFAGIAIHVEHKMQSGHTLNWYFWDCEGLGEISLSKNDEVHKFDYKWKCKRATSDWSGASLSSNRQLFRVERLTA